MPMALARVLAVSSTWKGFTRRVELRMCDAVENSESTTQPPRSGGGRGAVRASTSGMLGTITCAKERTRGKKGRDAEWRSEGAPPSAAEAGCAGPARGERRAGARRGLPRRRAFPTPSAVVRPIAWPGRPAASLARRLLADAMPWPATEAPARAGLLAPSTGDPEASRGRGEPSLLGPMLGLAGDQNPGAGGMPGVPRVRSLRSWAVASSSSSSSSSGTAASSRPLTPAGRAGAATAARREPACEPGSCADGWPGGVRPSRPSSASTLPEAAPPCEPLSRGAAIVA
mmetsp:Transcript_25871/g.97437  ORF Transcript_25871/g.97437 Transcript_25871/m.97437 type:complete len:286 (-) Transcript_25871:4136-4993(-)